MWPRGLPLPKTARSRAGGSEPLPVGILVPCTTLRYLGMQPEPPLPQALTPPAQDGPAPSPAARPAQPETGLAPAPPEAPEANEERTAGPAAPGEREQPAEPAGVGSAGAREPDLRFWLRPAILALLVAILLALTWWDQQRVPSRPATPAVLVATPGTGSAAPAQDPALMDTLARLRVALERRDARAFASLVDPEGLIVAAYGGALPDDGYHIGNALQFAQQAMSGSHIRALNWRSDGRGRVIALTDGWLQRPLHLSPNSTLEMTPFAGIGLAPRAGVWYVRWVLPDPAGVLAQQAGTLPWQPWPS